MDSLTQVVLGAAVGEATLGRRAGRKAAVWGAVGGTIPDLDVLAQSFLDPVAQADFHRGFSHSFVFSLLVAPVLGWIIARIHRKEGLSIWPWAWLMFLALVTHPLLDIFTTWGTEFFWPFSNAKIALNSIFVVDPLYTFPFLLFLILALRLPRGHRRRAVFNWVGIIWSCLYLGFGLVQKARARGEFNAQFAKQEIHVEQYMTRPTPLNTFLWGVVARDADGFWLGYHSLPSGLEGVHLVHYPADPIPPELAADPRIETLLHITKGYLMVRPHPEGWLISDLRYMTTEFQLDGDEDFIFNYLFRKGADGDWDIELQRMSPELDSETANLFWSSIWNGP